MKISVGDKLFYKFGDRPATFRYFDCEVLMVNPSSKVLIRLPHPLTGVMVEKWVMPSRLKKTRPKAVTAAMSL